jgi:anti-sigma28 factor (negative regulator of flagellin synthesis)
MKIYDNNIGGAGAAETQRQQDIQQTNRTDTGQSAEAGSDSQDRVEISGTLGRLSRSLTSFQSNRASRLQAVTAQYQDGTYQPDSAVISRNIVSEALSAGLQ